MHTSTGKTGTISSPGGWYDAGDFGKYVVNAGISVGTLLSFYENFNDFFADSSILIPESGNGENDLLDEVKYELDWLKTMQDEDGGVFHKLTTLSFDAFIMPEDATRDRYAIGKSTASALDFAAVMAMAGRIYTNYDSAYAADCVARAENAWAWAKANPAIYFKNPSDVYTGEYGDGNVSDEFIWAAAELFITTGEAEYKSYLESKSGSLNYWGTPGWPNVQPMASLSLATRANGLSESMLNSIRNSVVSTSDKWLNEIAASPARIPVFGYYWGSNSGIANIGVGLLYANILTNDPKYIRGAAECADYILGKNGTGYSFESSYGYRTPMNFHDRPSGSDGITQPVPGYIAGGPSMHQEDDQNYPFDNPAKSYVDVEGSYASNEICINWNSPFTALLAGVDAILGDQSEVDFQVPTTVNNPPVISIDYPEFGSDEPFIVKGTATDPDGISKVEIYFDTRYETSFSSDAFEWSKEGVSPGMHTITVLAYDNLELTTGITKQFDYLLVSHIPGRIEAEDYTTMSGIETEATNDTEGGGLHVISIQAGDYLNYSVNTQEAGDYRVEYRVSSSTGGGSFELRKMAIIPISSINIETEGGDQNWITISDTVFLDEGRKSLKIHSTEGGWNLNWINFVKVNETSVSSPRQAETGYSLTVAPNPARENFTVHYKVTERIPVEFNLYDSGGRLIEKRKKEYIGSPEGEFPWTFRDQPGPGLYYLMMRQSGRKVASIKLLKQ